MDAISNVTHWIFSRLNLRPEFSTDFSRYPAKDRVESMDWDDVTDNVDFSDADNVTWDVTGVESVD